MSACAGSLTDGFAVSPLVSPRIYPARRRRFFQVFTAFVQFLWPFRHCAGWLFLKKKSHLAIVVSDQSDWKNAVAGQVQMDRAPGRIRVHEHAETGKPLHPSDGDLSPGAPVPLAAYKLHQALGGIRNFFPPLRSAVRMFIRQRWNGPNMVGHKLSALGLPYRKARS